MSFSLPQRIKYFNPMVDAAWRAHCEREDITDSTFASKDSWYRLQLSKCIGFTTTKFCNKTSDFEKLMAWFEELADAGIYWQLQVIKGDAKRARFLLQATKEILRLTPEYIAAIANRMGLAKPERCYTAEEALNLRIALLTHVRRKQDHIVQTPPALL